jgi:hypothetical protein
MLAQRERRAARSRSPPIDLPRRAASDQPPMAPAPTMQTFIAAPFRFPSITTRKGDEFATASAQPARRARVLARRHGGRHTTSLSDEAPPLQVGIPPESFAANPPDAAQTDRDPFCRRGWVQQLMERDEAGTLGRLKVNRSAIFDRVSPRTAGASSS